MRVEQNFTSKEAISQEEYDVARSIRFYKAQSQLIKAQIAKQQFVLFFRKNRT
jgi:beta-galactosidase beta subunit